MCIRVHPWLKFREMVLRDPALQARLRAAEDLKEFAPLAVMLARERGCELSEGDIEEEWRAARRAWIERWI